MGRKEPARLRVCRSRVSDGLLQQSISAPHWSMKRDCRCRSGTRDDEWSRAEHMTWGQLTVGPSLWRHNGNPDCDC